MGRRFNILWAGQIVSQLGDRMAYLTIPLYLVELQGSSIQLGISYALENAPMLIIGFVGGVWIDRLRVRWLMIVADILRAALFLALSATAGGLIGGEGSRMLLVFAVAFTVGGLTNLFETALLKILPDIVAPERLASANGRMTATVNLGNIAGPALAGLLVAVTRGFELVFAVDAITFLVSAASLVLLGPVKMERIETRSTFRSDLATGLRYLWNEARLRATTMSVAVANLVVGFIEATFVLIAQNENLVGATEKWQLGVLYSVFGLGAIAGAVTASRFVRFLGLGRTMVLGMIGFPIAWILFLNTPFSVTGCLYLFITFVLLMFINVPVATIRQTYTPAILRGRVIAASRAIGLATLPFGAMFGAIIAEATGQFETLVRTSAILILAAGLALLPTIVWRDTFGPGPGRRVRPDTGRDTITLP